MKISILDCTLRDGGYVNDWKFKDEQIVKIVSSLGKSHIDIVECGYLNSKSTSISNSTLFSNIKATDKFLTPLNKSVSKVVMINYGDYDTASLPQQDETSIDGIRLAFHKNRLKEALKAAENITKLGYKLYFQPMVTKNYSDLEFLKMIEKVNKLNPFAFYIVDSFGSMTLDEFNKYVILANSNLKKSISLGYHSHNNMQLAFSNAVNMCSLKLKRDIVLDSSIYGIGRGAGNLNTELIADFLNKSYKKEYKILPLLEIIDKFLVSLMKKTSWGFSPAQYLSASFNCHPSYATYLINKNTNHIVSIQKILSNISKEKRNSFDKKYIEDLYLNFVIEPKLNIKKEYCLIRNKKILLIASGKSINKNLDVIKRKSEDSDYILISLNHIPEFKVDYYLFTNQKRFDEFKHNLQLKKTIITNNISTNKNILGILDFKKYAFTNGRLVTNIAIIMINYLIAQNIKKVELMGLDGYKVDTNNYNYDEPTYITDSRALLKENETIQRAILYLQNYIKIDFLTPTLFKQNAKQKIIGVIPSRYASTRLPGKPLLEIEGIPMVIHVLKRALMSDILDEVYVATDDKRIFDAVEKYGGKAIMTDKKHNNGSERMHEVSQKIIGDVFVVINGDEALLRPEHINIGINGLLSSNAPVSLLYNNFSKKNSVSDFKVVLNRFEEILYISRNDIPSDARNKVDNMYKAYHIMSYTKEFLDIYATLEQTRLDKIESHELLRVLEYGYKIKAIKVDSTAISVDTKEDLEFVREKMKSDPVYLKYKDSI